MARAAAGPTAIAIAADEARRLALALQGLAEPPRRRLSADGLLGLIERLGFVQIDSVSAVARADRLVAESLACVDVYLTLP